MTSQGEGLPQALIEAFSCGLPAVIADDADIGEIAFHQINALLVSQKTPTDFADAIVHLLTDSTLYGNLRAGALKIRNEKKILIVVGAEKVPRDVYDMADYNVAIGNQPHSEVSALGVLLDRIQRGKQLSHFTQPVRDSRKIQNRFRYRGVWSKRSQPFH